MTMSAPSPSRLAALALCTILLAPGSAAADDSQLKLVTLGSGGTTGIYYPVGRALCSVINKSRREHGVRCSEEATPGSVYNLERLAEGELDFALAQSDVQFAAYRGVSGWARKPFFALRSVLSLHPEVVTLLVRRDGPIGGITDLWGKRVNIGNPGSGTRASWDDLAAALEWTRDDLAEAAELRPDAAGYALCNGKLDANLLMYGHPSALVAAELARCEQRIVPVTGPAVDRLVAESPYYSKVIIMAGTYGIAADVQSFGGKATLVTTASQPEEVVYVMTKQILANVAELRTMHPALASLVPSEMVRDALTAPIHPGAERAFREMGLLK